MSLKIASHWEKLPRWIRVAIFGVVFAIALVAAPELILLLDLGSIEQNVAHGFESGRAAIS